MPCAMRCSVTGYSISRNAWQTCVSREVTGMRPTNARGFFFALWAITTLFLTFNVVLAFAN